MSFFSFFSLFFPLFFSLFLVQALWLAAITTPDTRQIESQGILIITTVSDLSGFFV